MERVKEFSELPREPPEFVEPRPPSSWPSSGEIKCEDLVIRYAVRPPLPISPSGILELDPDHGCAQPELPNVLHHLSFEVLPGEKVGVLGRTGSGKSTLALSFFRFVEPVEGRILVDGLDIAKIGLTDLRSKLTIIPRECGHSLAFRPRPMVPASLLALRPVPFRIRVLIPLPPRALRRGPRDSERDAPHDVGRVR